MGFYADWNVIICAVRCGITGDLNMANSIIRTLKENINVFSDFELNLLSKDVMNHLSYKLVTNKELWLELLLCIHFEIVSRESE